VPWRFYGEKISRGIRLSLSDRMLIEPYELLTASPEKFLLPVDILTGNFSFQSQDCGSNPDVNF
jgi:hypothetical protein